ncbi:helix-turn-helix domain-containing protein [Chryseobacterium carnipullorum]|uniref:helix-turn-helix domain-containing protein n=1 Tax=Chryseobacterium carnipullorum TaxID=1124835 RepID=UPI002938E380|nr:AraC family transcriptional regulator [Chryseobacterium carnipullorum]
MKDSIRGILFSQETAEKVKESFLNLSKMNSFESFIEIMKILNELAIAEDKTVLSSYSIELETFADNDRMKIVHDFVHKNFENKITLHDAASLINMSSVTFNRFIKKRTGKTFVNYLNEIRISYAARWLMEKNLTVFETAFEAGFNNIANFNKVFKSIKKQLLLNLKNFLRG